MPRIIDTLDAAVGRTPTDLDDDVDYLTLQPAPPALFGPDERYVAGWFEHFSGAFNFQDTHALQLALQAWVHLSINTPERFIVLNLADLGKAGQTAILIANKSTGDFTHAASTKMFGRNEVTLRDDFRHFVDRATGSFVATDATHDRWNFSVHVGEVHLMGTARRVGGPAFTQVTRFQRMRGSLQRYGNLIIERAMLSLDDTVIQIRPGTLGTFDHTVGHQRGLQNWNWVAAVGMSTCVETGERSILGVQVAVDRSRARPIVRSMKHAVWVDGRLQKVPTARFEYDYTNAAAKETGPWTIRSDDRSGCRWLNLHFEPRFHRRERKSVVLVDADFNQYYGILSGEVHIDGRTWLVENVFCVTEESTLEL